MATLLKSRKVFNIRIASLYGAAWMLGTTNRGAKHGGHHLKTNFSSSTALQVTRRKYNIKMNSRP